MGVRAYQKCGFVIEGREREAALVESTNHDLTIEPIVRTPAS
jgi:hypothetical protein